MEGIPENSAPSKPVIVRVKRKVRQPLLDAFWLEINERPLKRAHLEFEKLSLYESVGVTSDDSRAKKVLMYHVETIESAEAIKDVLHSFASESKSFDEIDFKKKTMERRQLFKQAQRKQDQLLSAARVEHAVHGRNARFKQIWNNRNRSKESMTDDFIDEFCHLYDVVRVDSEEETSRHVPDHQSASLDEDNAILCNYLPLIREYLPTAAAEIESDMKTYEFQQDDFVYDLYAVRDDCAVSQHDGSLMYPRVQVQDDYYDGGFCESECETDDSNAENNPLNDYPDEESTSEHEEDSSVNSDQCSSVDEDLVYEDEERDRLSYREEEDYMRWAMH